MSAIEVKPKKSSEELLKGDFRRFMYYVWKNVFLLPQPTPKQYDIGLYLETGPRRRMIQAFRGVGKSFITSAFIVWRLWRNPDEKVLVVSANEKFAIEIAGFIKKIMYGCDFLQEIWPAGGIDNQRAFEVAGAKTDKSPSMKAEGITGQITGSRATIVLFDDVEVPKNSSTELMREKLQNLTGEAADVLVPGGEIIYLGTPQSDQSIYRHLPSKGYDVRIWPARYPKKADIQKYAGMLAPSIMADIEANPELCTPQAGSDLGGAPTDPLRFDHAELISKEVEKGRSAAALQYMLDTRLSDELKYPLKTRDLLIMDVNDKLAPQSTVWASGEQQRLAFDNMGLDGDGWYAPMHVSDRFDEYQGTVMYIDPSGKGADETAYCVTSMMNGQVFVRRWGGLTDGYSEETLAYLAEVARSAGVNKVLIEANFGGGMFSALFRPVLGKVHPCTIDEYTVSGQKELRIIGQLEPALSSHRVIMDKSIVEAALKAPDSKNNPFFQMTRLTRDRGSLKHDDRIEILGQAVGHWMESLKVDQKRQEDKAVEKALMKMVKEKARGLPGYKQNNRGRSFQQRQRLGNRR